MFAAFILLKQEVLPDLSYGYNPNLLSIASAGKNDPPVLWTIQVIDDPKKNPETRRKVGEAVTGSITRDDGWCSLKSRVVLDSSDLFKGTPLASIAVGRLLIDSHYQVDPKGNLDSLQIKVVSDEAPEVRLTVDGKVVRETSKGQPQDRRFLELVFRSKGTIQTRRFPYESKGMVGNMFGPMDRLPGLRVGQRWETSMVNPISGQVERVRAEVVRRSLIHWGSELVSTFEVVQSIPPLTSARSWVRTDGYIVLQELPLPFVRLILERQRPTESGSGDRVISP